jgi:hypothetical protein
MIRITHFTVCTDCNHFIAFGEHHPYSSEEEDEARTADLEEFNKRQQIRYWHESTERVDEFSVSRCDVCCTRVGGERFQVEAVVGQGFFKGGAQ